MSVFNRVVVVTISVVILIGAVVTLLVSTGVSAPDILPFGWFETQLQRVTEASVGGIAATLLVSIIIALGMLTLLFFEFIPIRKTAILVINSTEKGSVTIDRESVCLLAEKTAITSRGVHAAKCSLAEGSEGLAISCRTSAVLVSNIPELSTELQGKIKDIVEELTGLAVAQVDINARYVPGEARRLTVR